MIVLTKSFEGIKRRYLINPERAVFREVEDSRGRKIVTVFSEGQCIEVDETLDSILLSLLKD